MTVLAVTGLLVLAGCGTTGSEGSGAADSAVPSVDLGAAERVEAPEAGEVGTGGKQVGTEFDPAQDQVVVTGSATVRVEDSEAALAALTRTVTSLDGRVSSSSISKADARGSAWAQVRVPSDSYEELTDSLSGLGDVVELSTSTDDVGQRVADLDARQKALQASIDRLTALIDQAETTADLLEAERELTTRQAELDSLTGQRRYLADQVAYSTLSVTLDPQAEAVDPDPSIWQRSWTAFLESAEAVLTVVVFLVPWLVVAAVIGVPLWWARRRRRNRGAADAAQAATSPHADGPGDDGPQDVVQG